MTFLSNSKNLFKYKKNYKNKNWKKSMNKITNSYIIKVVKLVQKPVIVKIYLQILSIILAIKNNLNKMI